MKNYSVYAYFHLITSKHYELAIATIAPQWKNYQLFNNIVSTKICVPKDCQKITSMYGFPNATIIETAYAKRDYEIGTIYQLYIDAQNMPDDALILYQHLKGCSELSITGKDSRRCDRDLLHTKISQISLNLFDDPNIQAVGANLCDARIGNKPCVHFSGNFWIARVSWIKQLHEPTLENAKNHFGWWVPPSRISKGIGQIPTDSHRYFWEAWIGQPKLRSTINVFIDALGKIRLSP